GFDPSQITFTGGDGVTYATRPMDHVGAGENLQMVLKQQYGIGAAPEPAAAPKDAGRDDTPAKEAPAAAAASGGGAGGGATSDQGVGGGTTPDRTLSTGGGGSDVGEHVWSQLTTQDHIEIRQNWARVNRDAAQHMVRWYSEGLA